MAVELVLFTVGGVQRFLAETRKSVDIAGASLPIRQVVIAAATDVREALTIHTDPVGLIFPAPSVLITGENAAAGVTNKIAFIALEDVGASVARQAQVVAERAWRDQVRAAYEGSPGGSPDTPGMPDVSWVCVRSAEGEEHAALWAGAQAAMTARRRSRTFTPQSWQGIRLCQQSATVPAVAAPRKSARHERRELLSAAGWTKRAVGNLRHSPTRDAVHGSVIRPGQSPVRTGREPSGVTPKGV